MINKYIVIGNPIEHSLSPKLHNYWIKKNNLNAIYEKKLTTKDNLKNIIDEIKDKKIHGINVTVPFKNSVTTFIDKLSPEAKETNSVNTIYLEDNKIIGHNTDIAGFELGLRHLKYDVKNKKVFIFGAGGVVPSILFSLKRMGTSKIILCNRTKQKAEYLKNNFKGIEVVNWGEEIPKDVNMVINATSIGLKEGDSIKINYEALDGGKFFFDVIYNPNLTNFLKKAKKFGNRIENGKMMFIYQAHQAFTIWHKIMPVIDNSVIKLLDND